MARDHCLICCLLPHEYGNKTMQVAGEGPDGVNKRCCAFPSRSSAKQLTGLGKARKRKQEREV